jgi:hypothetical protein
MLRLRRSGRSDWLLKERISGPWENRYKWFKWLSLIRKERSRGRSGKNDPWFKAATWGWFDRLGSVVGQLSLSWNLIFRRLQGTTYQMRKRLKLRRSSRKENWLFKDDFL